jgi:hypothetical protein
MPLKPILLKLQDAEHARWKAAADACRCSLSEWIRTQCERSFRGAPEPAEREIAPARPGPLSAAQEAAQMPPNVTRLDGPAEYLSHAKGCTCFLCESARSAGLIPR